MKLFGKNYDDIESTKVWKWYDHGVDWHRQNNLYSDTETFYHMVEAEQWHGMNRRRKAAF
jgi:hypothetical protein